MDDKYQIAIDQLKRAKVLLLLGGWVKGAHGATFKKVYGLDLTGDLTGDLCDKHPSNTFAALEQACSFCSLGALIAAETDESVFYGGVRSFVNWIAPLESSSAIAHETLNLAALKQSRALQQGAKTIIDFNDDPRTTFADVCRMFDHAIALIMQHRAV